MPSQEYFFTVDLPLARVWDAMLDRVAVAGLFPGCKEVKILNETDSLWTVAFSLGPFSKTVELMGHTTELKENERIAWTATHDLFTFAGIASFREVSEKETEVNYQISVDQKVPASFFQDILVGERMRALGREFIQRLKEYLEAQAPAKG